MHQTDRLSGLRIVGSVTPEDAEELRLSSAFGVYYSGDPDRIRAMFGRVAADPYARLAVAIADGEVVGYIGVVPPLAGDRLFGLPMKEIATVEVVEAFRRRGIGRALFEEAMGSQTEDWILYATGDPAFALPTESPRDARRRFVAIGRAFGFFPYPTTTPDRAHRDSVFLLRVGSDVATVDVEDLFTRLRGWSRPDRVALYLKDPLLRNLLRSDLEHSGFEIVAVGPRPRDWENADAVVTEQPGAWGRLLTVHVIEDGSTGFDGSVARLAETDLDRLPRLLRTEIARRRTTRHAANPGNA